MALSAAVEALVATHPEPERFAEAFHRSVRLSADFADPANAYHQRILDGRNEVIRSVELASSVPLQTLPASAGDSAT